MSQGSKVTVTRPLHKYTPSGDNIEIVFEHVRTHQGTTQQVTIFFQKVVSPGYTSLDDSNALYVSGIPLPNPPCPQAKSIYDLRTRALTEGEIRIKIDPTPTRIYKWSYGWSDQGTRWDWVPLDEDPEHPGWWKTASPLNCLWCNN